MFLTFVMYTLIQLDVVILILLLVFALASRRSRIS